MLSSPPILLDYSGNKIKLLQLTIWASQQFVHDFFCFEYLWCFFFSVLLLNVGIDFTGHCLLFSPPIQKIYSLLHSRSKRRRVASSGENAETLATGKFLSVRRYVNIITHLFCTGSFGDQYLNYSHPSACEMFNSWSFASQVQLTLISYEYHTQSKWQSSFVLVSLIILLAWGSI